MKNRFIVLALMFIVHFAISLVFNWIFGEREPIGETLIFSVLFVLIYSALLHFLKKGKQKS